MKLLASFFYRLYQYATVCIVVGSPLLFIPRTGFAPEITYYITMMFLVAIAIVSYVISALITKTWHSVSRLEFFSYFAVTIALIGSVLFARDPRVALFGDLFNSFAAVPLLTLPVIMYLVRALPESLRQKLKYVLVGILGISAFVFVSTLMFTGQIIDFVKQIFSGFSSSSSFAVYMGIFVVGCLLFVYKVQLSNKYKVAIVITAILFMSWAVAILSQNNVRPSFGSTLTVGKGVLIHNGIFGMGAGDFSRAWQLYRPQSVVDSPLFGYDFSEGSDTMSTLLVTIGIVGLLAFMMLVLSSLYSTFISYRQVHEGKEHFILGLLTFTLLYFVCIAWFVPLSYAMLVVWMVLAGLGIAKAHLTEYHPSKKLGFLMVPVAILLAINIGVLVQKTRAFSIYTKAQSLTNTDDVASLLAKAVAVYPFDGFYRAQVNNLIQANRILVATTTLSQDEIRNKYLINASSSVDAGLSAVKMNPANYQNYISLGQAYELAIPFEKEGGFNRAKQSYEEAVKIYPENPYLYIMLARLEASAGTKEGVRVQLTEALQKKQNFADALYLMSQLEASESRIDDALKYAIEAVKNAPNDPLVYIQAGLLYYGQRDYQNAVSSLQTALQKDPNNANVAYFLALALRDGGRPDLARQIADELMKRNPGNTGLEAFIKSLDTSSASTKTPAKTK